MTDIETLESIITDYIDQNQLSVVDTIALLEAIKFRVLYNNEMLCRDDEE